MSLFLNNPELELVFFKITTSGKREGHLAATTCAFESAKRLIDACSVWCTNSQAIASCILDPDQGAYVISVETPVPLDLVMLHSAVHMDLLESDEDDDRGQASTKRTHNNINRRTRACTAPGRSW